MGGPSSPSLADQCWPASRIRHATAVISAAPFPLPSSDWRKVTSHLGESSLTVSCITEEKLKTKRGRTVRCVCVCGGRPRSDLLKQPAGSSSCKAHNYVPKSLLSFSVLTALWLKLFLCVAVFCLQPTEHPVSSRMQWSRRCLWERTGQPASCCLSHAPSNLERVRF